MNGATFATIKFDLPSRIMLQWFGVSANAFLNTRWAQFINDSNYKVIDSNMMDCANVTKIPTPPSAKRYLPWPACAVQKQFRDREWRVIERHYWLRTAWWKCVFRASWTLNINAWDANCLFAINAQCLKKTRTLRDGEPVKRERLDERCISAFR